MNPTSPAAGSVPASVILLPLFVAAVALAGSLWLSVGMALKACPLCFYQRTFVMGVVAVLGIGLLAGKQHRGVLNLLSLPLVVAGLGVAGFHVYLEWSGALECPAGIMGIGTAPQQSLVAHGLLLAVVAAGVARSARAGARHETATLAGVVLGALLAWGAIASAPPMPLPPTKAYPAPPDICRPPYRQQ